VHKLDIFRKTVFVHDNLRLYCKLRCNVISLATVAQWHREWKEVWRQEVASFGHTATHFEKEWLRVLRGPICPQISPKWKMISAKTARNLPKLRESCAPWQKLRGCAKTRKLRKSCAPQHRNFLVGLTASRYTINVISIPSNNWTYPPLPPIGPSPIFFFCDGGFANDISSVVSPRLYKQRAK